MWRIKTLEYMYYKNIGISTIKTLRYQHIKNTHFDHWNIKRLSQS
jgi:hypothetical protein